MNGLHAVCCIGKVHLYGTCTVICLGIVSIIIVAAGIVAAFSSAFAIAAAQLRKLEFPVSMLYQ